MFKSFISFIGIMIILIIAMFMTGALVLMILVHFIPSIDNIFIYTCNFMNQDIFYCAITLLTGLLTWFIIGCVYSYYNTNNSK